MSETILIRVLNGEIDVKTCVEWLRFGDVQDTDDFPCSRADFVINFMAYLKNQTECILQSGSAQAVDTCTPTQVNITTVGQECSTSSCGVLPVAIETLTYEHNRTSKKVSVELFPNKTSIPINEEVIKFKNNSSAIFSESKDNNIDNKENICRKKSVNDSRKERECVTPVKSDLDESFKQSLQLSENVSDNTDSLTDVSEICSTPTRHVSLDKDCLFSPVTPIDASAVSAESFLRFSTPNNSISKLEDSNSRVSNFSQTSEAHSNSQLNSFVLSPPPSIETVQHDPSSVRHQVQSCGVQNFIGSNFNNHPDAHQMMKSTQLNPFHAVNHQNLNWKQVACQPDGIFLHSQNLQAHQHSSLKSPQRAAHNLSVHAIRQGQQVMDYSQAVNVNVSQGSIRSSPSHRSLNSSIELPASRANKYPDGNKSTTFDRSLNKSSGSRSHNLCIGDFLTQAKAASVDKQGKKKKNSKFQNLSFDRETLSKIDTQCGNRERKDSLNFEDREVYPEIGTKRATSGQGVRRRINPTRLNTPNSDIKHSNAFNSGSKFGVKYDKVEQHEAFKTENFQPPEKASSFSTERNILKMERQKLIAKFNTVHRMAAKSPSKTVTVLARSTPRKAVDKAIVVNRISYVRADRGQVCDAHLLETLSIIYSTILDCNMVLNIMTEIYFLISLVVAQQIKTDERKEKNKSMSIFNNSSINLVDSAEAVIVNTTCSENMSTCTNSEKDNDDNFPDLKVLELNTDENDQSLKNCNTPKNDLTHKTNELQLNANNVCAPEPEIVNEQNTKVYELLSTIHNCIFFALATLEKQKYTLSSMLDKNSIRLLYQNERVKDFSREFAEYLAAMHAAQLARADETVPTPPVLHSKNVYFITDTDSADNFPSVESFCAFKKQRDLFYDVLRTWEREHQTRDWSFAGKLGYKMKSLLGLLNHSPANAAHLARLFREQLLASCAVPHQDSRQALDELQSAIGPAVSRHRLSKLEGRLRGEGSRSHYEDFFRAFIVHADSGCFREHLINSLTQEICRLQRSSFLPAEDSETAVEPETREQFQQCLGCLRTLARFLGFTMAVPHGLSCSAPRLASTLASSTAPRSMRRQLPTDRVLQCELSVRCETQPPIDLIRILQTSSTNGRLVLTVPWMAELLVALDYGSLRLPYYRVVAEMLLQIYFGLTCDSRAKKLTNIKNLDLSAEQSTFQLNSDTNAAGIAENGRILIRLSLGWLFDSPNFPQEYFYVRLRRKNSIEDIQDGNPSRSNRSKFNLRVGAIASHQMSSGRDDKARASTETEDWNEEKSPHLLDGLEIIDENLLVAWGPSLRALLGGRDGPPQPSRHITPVTCSDYRPPARELQSQLEDWFLRSQGASTVRCVQVAGERVGAAVLRLARASLLEHRKCTTRRARAHVAHSQDHESLEQSLTMMYLRELAKFRERCERVGRECAAKRCSAALYALLPPGLAHEARAALSAVCTRRACQPLRNWLQQHASSLGAYTADLSGDIRNMQRALQSDPDSASMLKEEVSVLDHFDSDPDVSIEGVRKPTEQDEKEDTRKFEDVIHFATVACINLKELLTALVSGQGTEPQLTGGPGPRPPGGLELQLAYGLRTAHAVCRCSYTDAATKKTISQLCLDLAVFTAALHPSAMSSSNLQLFKSVWSDCLVNHLSPQELISLPYSNDVEHRERDELSLFTGYINELGSNPSENKEISENKNRSLEWEESDDRTPKESLTKSAMSLEMFKHVLCVRNVLVMERGAGASEAPWQALAQVLLLLLRADLLPEDALIQQCLAVYREDWPQKTLRGLAACMRWVSEKFSGGEKLRLFLDFLAEFCLDLEDYADY